MVGFWVVFCLALSVLGSTASADQLSQGVVIKIKATVAPHVFLIINPATQTITEAYSNSHSEGTPVAIRGDKHGPQIPLTPEILTQYETLKPSFDFTKIGTIYSSQTASRNLSAPQPALLTSFQKHTKY